jgi:hypothetical protein
MRRSLSDVFVSFYLFFVAKSTHFQTSALLFTHLFRTDLAASPSQGVLCKIQVFASKLFRLLFEEFLLFWHSTAVIWHENEM